MDISQRVVLDIFKEDQHKILNLMNKKDLLSEKLNNSLRSMQGVSELAAAKNVPDIIRGNIFKVSKNPQAISTTLI